MSPLLLALALLPADGVTFAPLKAGEVQATLTLRVEERTPAPGQARVLFFVSVTGPEPLEVQPLTLDDALAAWKVRWRGSGWSRRGDRVSWEQAVEVVQTRPGVVNLPAVRVPYTAGPSAARDAFRWDDLLRESRDVPPIEDPPPLPHDPTRLRVLAVLAALNALVGLAALGVLARRALRRPAPPLAPHERALRRLAPAALPPEHDAGAFHDRVAEVLRAYLRERFDLSAARTTPEVLAAALVAGVSPEARAVLGEVLAECDLVKFAGARPAAEACRATAARARAFVEATRPVEQARPSGPTAENGEDGRAG